MLQRWIAYLTFMHHPYCLFSWFQIRSSQIFIKMCIFSCSLYIGYHSNSSSEHLYTLKINIEPKSHPLQRKFIFGKSPFCGFHILVSRSIYIPKKTWKFFCRHRNVACFWERSSGKQASKTYFRHCEGALGPTLASWLEVFFLSSFIDLDVWVFSSVDFVF